MPRPVNADAAATKQRILDSALELFGQRGVDAVSLRELAADANVSAAMIHHCFGGKDGLRQAAIDTMYSQLSTLGLEMAQMLVQQEGRSLAEIFARAVRVSFEFGRRHRASVRLLHRDVIANGELDSRREAMTNGPFIDSVTQRVAEMVGMDAVELRWPLHACISLVTRYSASSDAELLRISGADTIERALVIVERNLQGTVRHMMRIPLN